MSKYTTGEIAKLCGVSVRTVQYYDGRGILVPTALSEGGRRLYSEADLNKMKVICFLRSLELPIDAIKGIFEEEQPERVISMLLQEQEDRIRTELNQKQESLSKIVETRKTLSQLALVTPGSMGDIAYILENKKYMSRLYRKMLCLGFVMDAIEVSTLMVWIFTGIWWPFALGMLLVFGLGIWVSRMYYNNTAFICPQCHRVFRPQFWESFFAWHTPYTRKLTCRCCGHHGFCVETYRKDEKNAEN